ncbi:MAG: CRISPR-associated endonuclease Cas2 [Candidatus Thorarchaeota archaeon]|nr:CRISPR-associated endonuclease Cas2 [Candidatus Thorarchaeota archaeon]
MHIIVIYDITDDGLRGKISERLKDYGLERIQFSAFQGELMRHSFNSLIVDMRRFLNDGIETDSIVIFQLCSSCFNGRIVLGAEKEMEKDEVRVSFF